MTDTATREPAAARNGRAADPDPTEGGADRDLIDAEARITDQDAEEKLSKVKAPPPKLADLPRPKMPPMPAGFDQLEPTAVYPAVLTNISVGRPVSNVTATLSFRLPFYNFDKGLLGAKAYAARFLGGFLGDGITIQKGGYRVDEENGVHEAIQLRVPRFLNESLDQLVMCLGPMLGQGGKKALEALFALDRPWRINVPGDFEGELILYSFQGSFDLTGRAGPDPEGTRREPVQP